MSAFNGIESVIDDMYSSFDSDITIHHKSFKTFHKNQIKERVLKNQEIKNFSFAFEQVVAIKKAESTTWGKLIGVQQPYLEMIDIKNHLIENQSNCREPDCFFKEIETKVLLAPAIAEKVKIETQEAEVQIISAQRKYDRKKPYRINTRICSGLINYNKETNESVVLTSLSNAQEMLGYPNEVTHVYVNVSEKTTKEKVKKRLQQELGPDFEVKTNLEKHELIYKTSKSEKSILMIMLTFIFFLAAINLISSLIILFVQKKEETKTLLDIGLSKKAIKRVYFFEGLLISFFGLIVGLAIGYFLCYLQIKFSFIAIDNDSIPYPMGFKIGDVFYIFSIVIFIGGIFSWLTAGLLSRNLS